MKKSVERTRSLPKASQSKSRQIETPARQFSPLVRYPPLGKLKKILVPIDFSQPSLKALRYALPFAEQFRATISLAHVSEPVAYPPDLPPTSAVSLACIQENEARRKLYDLGYQEIEEVVPIDVHVCSGKPADEIVNLAQCLEADLIVIATHGYKGLMHLVMGSTAEKVVRNAPCPVLVVREQEHEFL